MKMVGSDSTNNLIVAELDFSERECRLTMVGDNEFTQTIDGNLTPQKFRVNGAGFFDCLSGFAEGEIIKMSVAKECQATVLEDGEFHLATCQLRN